MDKNFINTYFKKSNIILFFISLAGINIIFNMLKQYSIANNFLLFSIFCSAFLLFALIIFNLKEIIQNKNYKRIYNLIYNIIFFIIILMVINTNMTYQNDILYDRGRYDINYKYNNIVDTYLFTQMTLLIYIFIPFLKNLLKKIKTKISNINPAKNLLPGDKILIIASILFALAMFAVYFDSKEENNYSSLKNNFNNSNNEHNKLDIKEFLKQNNTK